jgi:hypothetical protein
LHDRWYLPFDGAVDAKDDEEALPTAAAELLPDEVRAEWQRQFVKFACDDLNALFDRLAMAASEGTPLPTDIPARIESIVRALSWSRETVLGHLGSLIEEGIEPAQDAFATALIVRGLAPDDPEAQQWLAKLPPDVSAVIEYARR